MSHEQFRVFAQRGPSSGGGGKFWIVSVMVPFAATTGAGTTAFPLKPCEAGNGNEVGPPAGVSENGTDCEVVKSGETPVLIDGGLLPPP